MGLEVGSVIEGRITGITKFGAFVALPEGKSGLVHISEVANTYVSDVNEHVQVGQQVKVKVLNISDDGKINLSIKRAEPAPRPAERAAAPARRPYSPKPQQSASEPVSSQSLRTAADGPSSNQDFEDRLKKFMQESDSRIADNRMYSDRKQRSRRR